MSATRCLSLVAALATLPLAGLAAAQGSARHQHPRDLDCGFEEISAGLADYLARVQGGELQPAPPPAVPARSSWPAGIPGTVTSNDVFPYEDSAGLLLTSYSTDALIDLMVDAANELMAQHGDNFDFVGFWTNFAPSFKIGAAFYKQIENDVTGIGEVGVLLGQPPVFNIRPDIGLGGDHIEGFVMMWNVDNDYWQPGTGADADFTRLALGQEFEHRFALFLSPLLGGQVLQGDDSICGRTFHWNWKVDGQGSSMELSEWVGAAPATLAASFVSFNTDIPGSVFGYSDLYLMGYATAAEMDAGNSELRYLETSDCSSDYFGAITPFSSADVIAADGPRVPAAADEDKHYRTGWIMLHLPGTPPTGAQIGKAVDILNQHTADWSTSTLGLGSMDNTLPDVSAYGCGVNPPGSLSVLSGVAAVGATVTFGVDNPLGTQPAGSKPFLLVASAPDPAFPCGTLAPGFGMSAPGVADGELLLDPNAIVAQIQGPPWAGPGLPAPVDLAIPAVPALAGASAYAQGAMVDLTAPVGSRIAVTDALELVIEP